MCINTTGNAAGVCSLKGGNHSPLLEALQRGSGAKELHTQHGKETKAGCRACQVLTWRLFETMGRWSLTGRGEWEKTREEQWLRGFWFPQKSLPGGRRGSRHLHAGSQACAVPAWSGSAGRVGRRAVATPPLMLLTTAPALPMGLLTLPTSPGPGGAPRCSGQQGVPGSFTLYLLLAGPVLGRQGFTAAHSFVSKFPSVTKAPVPVIFLN